uniref:RRM domain-containing protein n=1 Tax=Hydatigena taeniaeformis TaxID=6205 RepID=A0A0R3WLX4_HYDTA
LPCGHTFCLRPCLLSNTNATKSYCTHCRATYDVAELRPNYAVLLQLNQLSRQQQQQQQQQQVRNQIQAEDQNRDSGQDQVEGHQVGIGNAALAYFFRFSCQEEDRSVINDASTSKLIFISGITPKITRKNLKEYFSRYGTVKNAFISPHKQFGSVTFESEASVRKALSEPIQFICGNRVGVKEYINKKRYDFCYVGSCESQSQGGTTPVPDLDFSSGIPFVSSTVTAPISEPSPEERQKIFVGGISHATTVDSLKAALSKLGPIKKVDVNAERGFAIVVFDRLETAELATSVHWHMVDDALVEMQPFIPNKTTKKSADYGKKLNAIGAQDPLHSLQLKQVQKRKRKGRKYLLMLRHKMNEISRQFETLKLKYPALKEQKKAKEKIINALDEVTQQLSLSANKALNFAMAELATLNEIGEKRLGPIIRQIGFLSDEMEKVDDEYESMDEITDLREALAKRKSLQRLPVKIAQLEVMIMDLPPLPITQMQVSDLSAKKVLEDCCIPLNVACPSWKEVSTNIAAASKDGSSGMLLPGVDDAHDECIDSV